MDSVGFAEDVRLCTRTSMPTQLFQTIQTTVPTTADQQRVQELLAEAKRLPRESETYAVCVAEVTSLVRAHVRPNAPEDVRLLFGLADPGEAFAARARTTLEYRYAWLDRDALAAACARSVDVRRDAAPPE